MGQLTDGLNALIRYSNEVTGASDGTISAAVETLVSGYGQGGGAVDENADVLFIDYDGTPIAGYTLAEAHALTALPTPPAHEDLIFDGWTYTLTDVHNIREGAEITPYYKTMHGGMRLVVNTIGGGKLILRSRWGAMKVSIPNVGEYSISSGGSTTITFPSKGEYKVFLEGTGAQTTKQCYPQLGSETSDTAAIIEINFPDEYYWESWYNISSLGYFCERVSFPKRVDGLSSMGSTFNSWGKLVCAPFIYKDVPATSAFANCSSLKYVSIPPFVTSRLETLFGETAIARLHINSPIADSSRISPGTKVRILTKIGNVSSQMADGCKSLVRFSTSDECTSIGGYAFRGTTLDFMRLGPNVATIGTNALGTIKVLVCEAITPPSLSSGMSVAGIYVPDSSVDAYKAASGWSNYANYIHPLSEIEY